MEDVLQHLQSRLGDTYRLERELTGGGMSRVFVATETALGRRVVIKTLRPDVSAHLSAERFKREIQLAARLQHPHIVPLLTAGDVDGTPFFTMPYVSGESLRARLAGGHVLPAAEATKILRDVASALAYAHENGVVHRDIKPDNVLLADGVAVVTDFGVARAVSEADTSPIDADDARDDQLTRTGMALGTLAYMAPEQAAADRGVDQRTDLYAFGCMAFELLTGAPPFGFAPPGRVIAAHLTQTPPRLDAPEPLASLIASCLEKDPARRPRSAREIIASLDGLSGTSHARRPRTLRTRVDRRAALIAGGAVVALALIAIGARNMIARRPAEQPRVVAVLPFESIGAGDVADSSLAYYADGMTDDLSSALGHLAGIRVVARSSAYTFKGKHLSPTDVAGALHADVALQGTIRRLGSRVRVTVEVSSTADGLSLGSFTDERNWSDLPAVQREMASRVSAALGVQPTVATETREPVDPVARDLFLRGRFFANRDSSDADLKTALGYYQQAATRNPRYAQAYAAIAETYLDLCDQELRPSFVLPRGRAAVNRALTLDSTLSDAWAVAANYTISMERDWDGGLREIARAAELNPSDPWIYVPESFYWAAMRDPERMMESMRKVLARDPLSPVWNGFASWEYVMANEPDSALVLARRTADLAPGFVYLDAFGGYAYLSKGLYADAEREFKRGERVMGHRSPGLAYLYAVTGRRSEALAIVHDIERSWDSVYVVPELVAQAYAGLGDRAKMYEWLERGVQAPSFAAAFDGVMPAFRPYWSEPRFQALFSALRIPSTAARSASLTRTRGGDDHG